MAFNSAVGGAPTPTAISTHLSPQQEASGILDAARGLAAKGQLTPEVNAAVNKLLNQVLGQTSAAGAGAPVAGGASGHLGAGGVAGTVGVAIAPPVGLTAKNTTYWKDDTTGASGSITDSPGDHKLLDALIDREMRSGHSFEMNNRHAYSSGAAPTTASVPLAAAAVSTGGAEAVATAARAQVSAQNAENRGFLRGVQSAQDSLGGTKSVAGAAALGGAAAVTDDVKLAAAACRAMATKGAEARLTAYATDTGKHIKPDGTLDLAGIKGDYTAPLEVRNAASYLLDADVAVDSGSAVDAHAKAKNALHKTPSTATTPTINTDKSLLGSEPNIAGASKAAMADNLNVLANHLSGRSDLSKEDFQKIANGNFGSLDHDIKLNAADLSKMQAAAKHVTENFDKFDTAFKGKDANNHVSPDDIRAYTDVQKTSDAIDASKTLLGQDTKVSNADKAGVKDNLSVLANHLSGSSNSSKEDFQKIASGDFSPLDHDISISDSDIAKMKNGAKYITENFDKFDTAGTGRSGGNGGVSPYDIRGYTDTAR